MKRSLLVLCLLLLAACSSAPSTTPLPPTDIPAEEASSGALEALLDSGVPPDERPAWHATPLTEVITGSTFTLAEYAGKTIYVQPITAGCAECLLQQMEVQNAKERLNPEQYVFITVSADPTDMLRNYATRYSFDWLFATATPAFFAALMTTFGTEVTTLTDTPHFIISPLGATSTLSTGQQTTDQLIAQLTAAAGA